MPDDDLLLRDHVSNMRWRRHISSDFTEEILVSRGIESSTDSAYSPPASTRRAVHRAGSALYRNSTR